MNHLTTLMTLALTCCCGAAQAQDTAALLKTANSPVQVVQPIAMTGLSFRDTPRIAVGPASELLVRQRMFRPLDAVDAYDLHLARGSARYSSQSLAKVTPVAPAAAVTISTPNTLSDARGTRIVAQTN
jgi:hypothetical protein